MTSERQAFLSIYGRQSAGALWQKTRWVGRPEFLKVVDFSNKFDSPTREFDKRGAKQNKFD